MKDIIIFGIGKTADIIVALLRSQSDFNIKGFCCDEAFVTEPEHMGLPVVSFETVETAFPASSHGMLVALGYHELNLVRQERCQAALTKGYELISWVSPQAHTDPTNHIGANCIVMPGAALQSFAALKDGVFVWHNAVVGHHSVIDAYGWLSANCTISSDTTLGARCFVGVNAAIGHNVSIGADSLIGAGTLVTHNTEPEGVYIVPDTPRYRLTSRRFLSITKMR